MSPSYMTPFRQKWHFLEKKGPCGHADTQKVGCRYQNDQNSKLTKKIFNLKIFFELFGSFRGAFDLKIEDFPANRPFRIDPCSSRRSKHRFLIDFLAYFRIFFRICLALSPYKIDTARYSLISKLRFIIG